MDMTDREVVRVAVGVNVSFLVKTGNRLEIWYLGREVLPENFDALTVMSWMNSGWWRTVATPGATHTLENDWLALQEKVGRRVIL